MASEDDHSPLLASTAEDIIPDASSERSTHDIVEEPRHVEPTEETDDPGTTDHDGDVARIIRCFCPEQWTGRNLVVCIDGTANQFGFKV